MPQAPHEAHRCRVRAGNVAPRLATFEPFPGFLSHHSRGWTGGAPPCSTVVFVLRKRARFGGGGQNIT